MENTNTATVEEIEVDERIAALAAFLECDPDDIAKTPWGTFNYANLEHGEYEVLTDSEADDRAKAYILDSLWAFNPSFLAGETGIDEDVYQAIANNGKCESNNDAILSLIKGTGDVDDFVDSAIGADGRGHFLNTYDGEENEQGDWFIYRAN